MVQPGNKGCKIGDVEREREWRSEKATFEVTIDNSINNLRIPIIRDQGKKNIITFLFLFQV